MSYLNSDDELWRCIASISESRSLAIYDIERPHGEKLIISICKANSKIVGNSTELFGENIQAGVSVEDCSQMVRELMVYFQVEGEAFKLGKEPEIEVCSPGVNRTLRNKWHFLNAINERVRIVFKDSINFESKPINTVIGVLSACDEDAVTVANEENSGQLIEVKLDNIKRAHVDFDFDRKPSNNTKKAKLKIK
ncbi:MAG: hypothetical protein IT292_00105 [Deltaproteobacteria bacterium]|nr:hypothetical protein [Deltaproteobacteria bacterium]